MEENKSITRDLTGITYQEFKNGNFSQEKLHELYHLQAENCFEKGEKNEMKAYIIASLLFYISDRPSIYADSGEEHWLFYFVNRKNSKIYELSYNENNNVVSAHVVLSPNNVPDDKLIIHQNSREVIDVGPLFDEDGKISDELSLLNGDWFLWNVFGLDDYYWFDDLAYGGYFLGKF